MPLHDPAICEANLKFQIILNIIQKIDRSTAATHKPLGTTAVGLNPQQRKRVLAGSDPLIADLMLAIDLLDDAVILLREDGRIIHCNHLAGVLALPIKPHAIHSLHLFGPGEPWSASRQMLREYPTSSGWLEREVHDPETGQDWALRLSALPYLGVFPRRLVLLVRDNTEAAATRARLREREVLAATGALLAGAAHQAKNAIFGLSATLDAFEAHLDRGITADHEYVDHLRAGITSMQLLMRDLLDYGNPTAGDMTLLSMAAMVQQSVSVCQCLARTMGCRFIVELADDLDLVGNSTRLVRALENLLENALQHSPQSASVTIRLSRVGDGNMARLDIIDQGPGYPAKQIDKLFIPFFTLRPGGTGLGLTIAKKIIEDMGGRIELSNGAAGGAQAAVFLPVHSGEVRKFRNLLGARPCREIESCWSTMTPSSASALAVSWSRKTWRCTRRRARRRHANSSAPTAPTPPFSIFLCPTVTAYSCSNTSRASTRTCR